MTSLHYENKNMRIRKNKIKLNDTEKFALTLVIPMLVSHQKAV